MVTENIAPKNDALWQRYDKEIDLYKYYLEIAVKGALFVFGITGALTSYYFTHSDEPWLVYALLLPIILNLGFVILFYYSINEARMMANEHRSTCNTLGITPFNMTPLPSLCAILAIMYLIVAIGLGCVIYLNT